MYESCFVSGGVSNFELIQHLYATIDSYQSAMNWILSVAAIFIAILLASNFWQLIFVEKFKKKIESKVEKIIKVNNLFNALQFYLNPDKLMDKEQRLIATTDILNLIINEKKYFTDRATIEAIVEFISFLRAKLIDLIQKESIIIPTKKAEVLTWAFIDHFSITSLIIKIKKIYNDSNIDMYIDDFLNDCKTYYETKKSNQVKNQE